MKKLLILLIFVINLYSSELCLYTFYKNNSSLFKEKELDCPELFLKGQTFTISNYFCIYSDIPVDGFDCYYSVKKI